MSTKDLVDTILSHVIKDAEHHQPLSADSTSPGPEPTSPTQATKVGKAIKAMTKKDLAKTKLLQPQSEGMAGEKGSVSKGVSIIFMKVDKGPLQKGPLSSKITTPALKQ